MTGEAGVSFIHALHALAHARERLVLPPPTDTKKRSVRGDELRFVLRPTLSLSLSFSASAGSLWPHRRRKGENQHSLRSGEQAQGSGRFVQVSDFEFDLFCNNRDKPVFAPTPEFGSV